MQVPTGKSNQIFRTLFLTRRSASGCARQRHGSARSARAPFQPGPAADCVDFSENLFGRGPANTRSWLRSGALPPKSAALRSVLPPIFRTDPCRPTLTANVQGDVAVALSFEESALRIVLRAPVDGCASVRRETIRRAASPGTAGSAPRPARPLFCLSLAQAFNRSVS